MEAIRGRMTLVIMGNVNYVEPWIIKNIGHRNVATKDVLRPNI